jgi:hypothetical protein
MTIRAPILVLARGGFESGVILLLLFWRSFAFSHRRGRAWGSSADQFVEPPARDPAAARELLRSIR